MKEAMVQAEEAAAEITRNLEKQEKKRLKREKKRLAAVAKSWLIWKDLDAEKDWRQEEKGTTENEMVGWYHQLDGHEFG